MPHSEILYVMKLMDSIRRDWNIVYPFERQQEDKEEVKAIGQTEPDKNTEE